MASRRLILLAVGAAGWLSSCTVGPDYQAPEVSVPVLFGSPSRQIVTQDIVPEPDIVRWWHTLHDPELNRLVELAVACNPDIEIALTRMQAMRTQQIVVIGSALPNTGASAGIAAGTGTDLSKGRVAQSIRAGDNRTGLQAITSLAGFDTGWELDLFGKYRRLLEAVRDDAQALAEVRNAVLISVIADVVRNYVEIRGLQLRLRINRQAVKAAQQNVDFVQARFNRGITNELDLTLAKRELATIQAREPLLTAAIADAESRLSVLLGTYSPEVIARLRRGTGLPRVPSRLRPGVPADLLRKRPDIRQAERLLAAATARIGVATADLFPTVTFTAGIGVQGGVRSATAAPIGGPIWSAGPGGYWPLLDFGRLDALIDIQELQAHEQLVNYKRTILAAVEEVDDAIKQYRAQQQRLRELSVALESAKRAVFLATKRYEDGYTDFLNVLDAQRQEFDIEDQNAVARQAVVTQYVALYKALGGGWELYDELPPLKPAEPAVVAAARRLTNDWH
ncbi:MAG TPA: efflux transporter outer membrane subunit [Hyphomicrobiales bacterium]|nr:efflux transporter outer membrane subunit [Hyphomicrobiales bacterium]